MARIIKTERSWHVMRILNDKGDGELLFVSGRKLAYISATGTYSGQQTLRKLAKAILKEIPKRKDRTP